MTQGAKAHCIVEYHNTGDKLSLPSLIKCVVIGLLKDYDHAYIQIIRNIFANFNSERHTSKCSLGPM